MYELIGIPAKDWVDLFDALEFIMYCFGIGLVIWAARDPVTRVIKEKEPEKGQKDS